MDLIIGGAYQGKLTYARERFAITDEDVFTCEADGAIDFSKRCVRHYETYLLSCVRKNTAPRTDFRADAVVIMRDISCGVVPMAAEERAWRECAGRTMNRLAADAASVTRLFCGLPHKLK